jgi:hypothetical protein
MDPADLDSEQLRPISRKEFDQMVALGMFEDERVELLRGRPGAGKAGATRRCVRG